MNNHDQGRVLIVDDEENIREILNATLKTIASKIYMAQSAEEALEVVKNENIDVIISDIQMPKMNGIEFLEKVKEEQPEIKFLMITAYGSMEKVIQCMRHGASDFLTKPFDNGHLRDIVKRLIQEKVKRQEPLLDYSETFEMKGVIGNSKQLKQHLDMGMRAAAGDSSILIMGESGTGKEVLAKAIHENSPRASHPFIPINCGAIPENLFESELFGYEKGAFTGAMEKKPGKFSLANKGTLFLDEVGEMPLSMQVKLLRALQERKIDPVGSTQSIDLDFRLVAATNKNLEAEVQNGNFREDLYYRLNVIPISLPPLRERGKDALLLAQYFLDKFNKHYNTEFTLPESDQKKIMAYSWPGNIRELENVMERAVVLGDKTGLFPAWPQDSGKPTSSFKQSKKNTEREEIIKVLEKNRWNKTHTAKELGISRRSLLYKVKEFQI